MCALVKANVRRVVLTFHHIARKIFLSKEEVKWCGEVGSGVGLRGRDHKLSKMRVYQSATLGTTYQCAPPTLFLKHCPLKKECYLWAMYSKAHVIISEQSLLMSNPEGDK